MPHSGADNGDAKEAPEQTVLPLSQYATQNTTHSSSYENIDDFFPEDQDVARASRRIQRILYRKREQKIASWPPIRRFLHITFYEPSSMRARCYMGLSTAVVALFLIVFMIDTFPQYRVRQRWRSIAADVNLATALFFAVEWVLRFYAFQRPLRYIFQPLTIIDLLGIIPGFIYYTYADGTSFGHVKWLRALQVLRVLRVLRLTEYSVELYVTIRTLRKSVVQILVVMMIIVIFLLTACFLLFYAENDSLDIVNVQWLRKNHGVVERSPYQNVFFCLYWGLVTVTTVGYGDYTPVSPWGQVIACFTMIIGVFTIVFPTSIISNNFATEWAAFRKAQKVREQLILQREYEHKRHDLSRVCQYANQDYGGPDSSSGDRRGNGSTRQADGDTQSESLRISDTAKGDSGKTSCISTQDHARQGHEHTTLPPPQQPRRLRRRRHQRQAHPSALSAGTGINDHAGSSEDEDMPYMSHATKLAPFEYNRIMDVKKRIEKDLGIPGLSLGASDADGEVNQNLMVNAMYAKLYNDAYGTLCERMLLRLIEQNGLDNVDEIVEYLQSRPTTEHVIRDWPHEKKLSVLEHKLLCFVFEKANLRTGSDFDTHHDHHASSDSHIHGMRRTQTHEHKRGSQRKVHAAFSSAADLDPAFSSPNVALLARESPTKTIRRRLKAKFNKAYGNLPMTRETTHQSIHSFMSSAIASDAHELQRPTPSSKLGANRKSPPRTVSYPTPLLRSDSDEYVDMPPRSPLAHAAGPSGRVGRLRDAPSSPEVVINVPSSPNESQSEHGSSKSL
ncbi:hypothetical protein GGI04_001517 [Coemansia thaxteri]|uniref:Ion transport domain-containing protein n=1 Tax=Coemansia thaxteri TaxID=2663907 RepID=A0A9W8EGP9_9FUNG|nr:hypothetical protein H4R26_005338 [Coemansia thaxteri]KAJ2007426.1 hypothetical protein GGI04_001517 [Coemansia thaxteri]